MSNSERNGDRCKFLILLLLVALVNAAILLLLGSGVLNIRHPTLSASGSLWPARDLLGSSNLHNTSVAARPPANRTSRRGSTVDDETTDQSSALHRAVFRGDQRLVERLLRSANARSLAAAQDSAGRTALHIAAATRQLAIGEALTAAGGDVSATDALGNGVIHYAIRSGDQRMIAWVVRQGAELLAQDQDGNTAMQLAVDMAVSVPHGAAATMLSALVRACLAKLLSAAACGVYARNKHGVSAHDAAVAIGSLDANTLHFLGHAAAAREVSHGFAAEEL